MKKKIIKLKIACTALFLAINIFTYSQVRIANSVINTTAANSSAFIDASSNTTYNQTTNIGKGFLYPRTDLTTFIQFSGLPIGAPNSYPNFYDGLMVYNTASSGVAGVGATEGTLCQGFWYYHNSTSTIAGGTWRPVRPCPATGTITALNCAGATNTGTLTAGAFANGVFSLIPYTGGNGGTHNGQTVFSTGVTGLTATLVSGSFVNGPGTLTYTITGTPSGPGTASFAINVGGQSCTITRIIGAAIGTIISLNCAGAVNTGTLIAGTAATGISSGIGYTGGNGGTYSGQTVVSTGVTGLTAILAPGSFANGTGTLTYLITGTPSGAGTASFAINVGNQSCIITRTINAAPKVCGAYIAPGVYKEFMCHNLGADINLDPFIPAAGIHGAKYQWGTAVPALTQPQDQAYSGTISGWNMTPVSGTLWPQISNPCPVGHHIPTDIEWGGVINNNSMSYVGTWTNSPTNYSSGVKIGSSLFLPATGWRIHTQNGSLGYRGAEGYYWASTVTGTNSANFLVFVNTAPMLVSSNVKMDGRAVRCIKD